MGHGSSICHRSTSRRSFGRRSRATAHDFSAPLPTRCHPGDPWSFAYARTLPGTRPTQRTCPMEMPVAFSARMDGGTQTLEHVDSGLPLLFREGDQAPRATSLCQRILDGELPPVIPDLTVHPGAMALPLARKPRVRSFASVPIELSDGTLYGT